MDNKTWTPKFILVVVWLVALGGVAYAGVWYWYYPRLLVEQVPVLAKEIPIIKPTDNLKTYTNTEYGFEIKYPRDWVLNDKDLPTSSQGNLFSLAKDGLTQTSKSLSFDDGAIISLGVTNTDGKVLDFSNKEITIDQWVENVSVGLGGDRVDNLPLAENGFVGKIRVVYNKEDFLKPWGEVGGAYKILPSGRVLLVSWQRMNLYTNDLSYTKYLLPILSSFKVIK